VPAGKNQEISWIAREVIQLAVKLRLIGGCPCHAGAGG